MCRKKMQKKNRKARHWHMKEAQKKNKMAANIYG